MSRLSSQAASLAVRGAAFAGGVVLVATLAIALRAAAEEPSCAARIAAVIDDIAARDLDTTDGPPLNAFLALNPYARDEAAALDRRTTEGEPEGPLHCMPVAVKDNFLTADMPTTVGSLSLIGNQAPGDAAFVARLREAGAIVVGKTNMDEFAFGIRGLSGAGGRVGNAYDPWRSPGGSSAGSGVAIGAGFVPLAVGSDNCGSLRIPAVYNGAVALRSTYGRFDAEGLFPIGFVNGTPGLIAPDVAALERGLAVIDDGWRSAEGAPSDALRGKRLGVLTRVGEENLTPGDPEVAAIFAETGARLRAAGAETVEDVAVEAFDTRLGSGFVNGSASLIDAMLAAYPAPRKDWADICRSGRIPPEWTADECVSLMATAPEAEAAARKQIADNRDSIVAVLDRLQLDGLVYLTDLRGGARADVSRDITCYVASASGLPAMALPAGLDRQGMPVGVELIGRAGSDETLVAMAAALEAARGPLPPAKRPPGVPELAAFNIAAQNSLRLFLGWRAFQSRHGESLGDLEADRFRSLVDKAARNWATTVP